MNEFQDPSFAEIVGGMYARWTLDCLVEIAHAVAKDFVARPEFYKGGEVADGIVNLRIEYGTSAGLSNEAQRLEINQPVFGASDAYSAADAIAGDKFRSLRKPLFDACSTFSERSVADAASSMRQAILSALELFQPYLRNFDGASIRQSYRQVLSVTDLSYSVLRSASIAQVFGVSPAPAGNWPIDSNDSSGALLVRAIGEKLQLPTQQVFNEEKFQRLRRVAQQGRDALHLILGFDQGGRDQDQLITAVYTWAISLRDYSSH